MSETPLLLEPSLALRLDEACLRFEDAWATGGRPRVEEYVGAATEPLRSALLRELIQLDVYYRRQAGEEVRSAEYQDRFPELDRDWLAGAVMARAGAAAGTSALAETRRMGPPGPSPGDMGEPAVAGYEVLGVLGRGGMGVVYKARHLKLNRVVALKMILSGQHAGPEELARFRREAEAAAQLQHPNIVQIHEVGEQAGPYGTGPVPYIALEYVEGGSLAQKLAGAPQPAREAARLVETLARALHAAHERGIVHRDLKPANVLLSPLPSGGEGSGVRGLGTPKVTDFGLAKRLGGDVKAEGPATVSGALLGTPSYMAPEQAGGRAGDATPRTDVYALGAILYELLTGRPPFKGATVLETLDQVRSQEPVPPSRLLKVPRDLETVCLKALTKAPTGRYGTAQELADDLRRWLHGGPVRARPVGPAGRLWRWCKRKPALASLAAALGLAVAGGFATVTWQWRRAEANHTEAKTRQAEAEDQRRQAEASFQKALDAVEQMLTRVGEERLADVPQMEQVRRKLLEDALSFYAEFLKAKGTEPAVRLGAGRAQRVVADVHQMLAEHGRAKDHYGQALDLLEPLLAEHPSVPEYRYQTAVAHRGRGNLMLLTGPVSEASKSYERAIHLLGPLAADHPETPRYRRLLASGHLDLGRVFERLGKFEDAKQASGAAQSILLKLLEDSPGTDDDRQLLAASHRHLAHLAVFRGRYQDAESPARQARELLGALLQGSPNAPRYRRDLANAHMLLGSSLARQDRLAEAEAELSQARDLYDRLATDFPSAPDYRYHLTGAQSNLSSVQVRLGRFEQAEKGYRLAIKHLDELVAKHPRSLSYRRDLANTHMALGNMLNRASRLLEAEKALAQAQSLYERLAKEYEAVAEYQLQWAAAMSNRGAPLHRLGRYDEAEALFRHAIAILEKLVAKSRDAALYRRDLANTRRVLGVTLAARDQPQEAAEVFGQASALWRELIRHSPKTAEYRFGLATTLAQMGDHAQAAKEAADGARLSAEPARGAYHAACVLSLCVAAAEKDSALPEAERREWMRAYGDRAIESLREAVQRGFRALELIKGEPFLDPLRPREDFQKLLSDLGEKAGPG